MSSENEVIAFCNASSVDEAFQTICWLPKRDHSILFNAFIKQPDIRFGKCLSQVLISLLNYGVRSIRIVN